MEPKLVERPTEGHANAADLLLKYGVMATGFAYILGFGYQSGFGSVLGIPSSEVIVSSEALISGFEAMFLFALGALGIMVLNASGLLPDPSWSRRPLLALSTSGLIIVAVTLGVFCSGLIVLVHAQNEAALYDITLMLFTFLIGNLLLLWCVVPRYGFAHIAPARQLGLILVLLSMGYVFASSLGHIATTRVHVERVRILVSDEAVDGLARLGLEFEPDQTGTHGAKASKPVQLIYSGGRCYVVHLSNGTTLTISKNEALAVNSNFEERR